MSNKKPESLRNSREPYIIELDDRGGITKEQLKFHIDTETRQFKIWHLYSLKVEAIVRNTVRFKNSNGNIHYHMQLAFWNKCVLVSCDCDRRVERLCHHSYTALRELIATEGELIFRDYTEYLLRAA
jgi:hypothetical protein